MRYAVLLALAIVIPAGCGHKLAVRPSPSVLQRFDSLRSQLRLVDIQSARVALDMDRLDRRMQAADVTGAQAETVRLKEGAVAFRRQAGRTANAVRPLMTAERNVKVRVYLRLAVEILSFQWAEGQQLERLADLVWADPLMLSPTDEARMLSVERAARADASQAVADAHRAAEWRSRYRVAFRYVPVGRSTAKKRTGAM